MYVGKVMNEYEISMRNQQCKEILKYIYEQFKILS